MKKLVLLVLVVLASCVIPVKPGDNGNNPPVYVPPPIDGATTKVIRSPSESFSRGLIAQSDPLFEECNEQGTLYMFYSLGAIVQYTPNDGFSGYPQLAMTGKMTVELHNALNPESDWWDYVTVSAPGPYYDLSHDPPCPVLTIQFRNNSGELALNVNGTPYNITATDAEEYATWANADGSPKQIIKLDFEVFGASDGVHVLHMQLGGDGISIPSATFHY